MRGRLYTDVAGKLQEGVATVRSAGSAFYIRTDLVFLIRMQIKNRLLRFENVCLDCKDIDNMVLIGR